MYEHYKPAQQIFVDREEYLSWMEEALGSCKAKSRILHLKGIGGIGKSTLLNHWTRTVDTTVRLDCQQYTEFYSRLDILAKGAVRIGVDLKRFDILWHIRKRFVEGVEPAGEKGREWAKEVLVAIPFIGSLASIGSAIKSVSDSVAPKLRQRYGEVGQWLQDRLGAQYLERLLEILWKEPQHAEFLYLDALLEDINNRKNLDTPILFLFDHSENVDSEERRWEYSGKKITEMELWYVFISSLKNCVGVIASRRAVPPLTDKTLEIEEKELTELDRDSCIELLSQRGVIEANFQDRILSISGGNPFVINAMCDMRETTEFSINDIEDLKAETLDEVRLKTWRRLFSHAKDLLNLVDRAGLLPSFNKESMNIVAPDMKTDQWERMVRLSFVKPRSNGSWVLHDLARELVRAELGTQLNTLVTDVSGLLKNASVQDNDSALLGIALSVKALDSEEDAITETLSLIRGIIDTGKFEDALTIVDNLVVQSTVGEATILGYRGMICEWLKRYAEAEFPLREAIRIIEESVDVKSERHQESIGIFTHCLGGILVASNRFSEAEPQFSKSLKILRKLVESKKEEHLKELVECLNGFAWLYYRSSNSSDGVQYALESLEIARSLKHPTLLVRTLNVAGTILGNTGQFDETRKMYREAINLQRQNLKESPDSLLHKLILATYLCNFTYIHEDNDEIEEIFKEVFRIGEDIAEYRPSNVAFFNLRYGWHCLNNNRFHEAEQHLLEALVFYDKYRKTDPQAAVYWSWLCKFLLIEVYIFDGRYTLARESIDKLQVPDTDNLTRLSNVELIALIAMHGVSGLYHSLTYQIESAEHDYEATMEFVNKLVIDTAEEVQFAVVTLNNYSVFFRRKGRLDDAEKLLGKAHELGAMFKAHWMLDTYTAVLNSNLALVFHDRSNFDEADRINTEAINSLEEFSRKMPAATLPMLAKLLNNSSVIKNVKKETNEALNESQKALEIKRSLAKTNPGAFRASLAVTLNNSGIFLYNTGAQVKAESHLQEALDIRRELVRRTPDVHSLELASTLQNLAIIRNKEGNDTESKRFMKEAIQIREKFSSRVKGLREPILNLSKDEILGNEIWSEETEPIYLMI
ncbi:MAG: tetratricopeptide repeat protein [Candidatus Thorarchaeota archaeon]